MSFFGGPSIGLPGPTPIGGGGGGPGGTLAPGSWFTDQLFNETTARTSETQMLSGTGTAAGRYPPKVNGRLIAIAIHCTPQAATSLCQAGHVKLIQESMWNPNSQLFPFPGWGLATAPQAIGGAAQFVTQYLVNLPIATDKQIDSLLIEFDSPVTPRIRVIGTFVAGA